MECVNSDVPFAGPKGSNLHSLVRRWKLIAPVTEIPAATFVANSSLWRSLEDNEAMAAIELIDEIKKTVGKRERSDFWEQRGN
jgi:hypothetical protein